MMEAAAVNVIELPSKQVHSIPLPNDEGGDMMNMYKFISLMRKKLSSEEESLMVGDRQITDSDKTRPVCYFLLDNTPWYAHTSVQNVHSDCYYVKTLTGKTIAIPCYTCETVWDLKKRFEELEHVPVDEQRHIYAGKQMDDFCNLSENVPAGSTIQLVNRLTGGGWGQAPGTPFVDVANKSGPKRMRWSKSAPVWRAAKNGLCLEGECTNRRCKAYGNMVIMNQGFTDFDLISDSHTCQCPLCFKCVVPITCGFNNCKWKVVGRKIAKLGQPPKMFKTAWTSAGDAYDRFSPDENGTTNFIDLKILCRRAQAAPICIVCTFGMHGRNSQKAPCGHAFHVKCFHLATSDQNCIECLANGNMTDHQKLFG